MILLYTCNDVIALCVVRPSCCRSTAAYSDQTFPCMNDLSVCASVRTYVDRSVQCIVENGGSDADAVWHHYVGRVRG